jgi:hypothetical protein
VGKLSEYKPIDMSKTLFLDLAFLLIASLVLLVRDPNRQEHQADPLINLRHTEAVEIIEDASIKGELLNIQMRKNGDIFEIVSGGKTVPLKHGRLSQRVSIMDRKYRVISYAADKGTPHEKFAAVTDELYKLKDAGEINEVYERVNRE